MRGYPNPYQPVVTITETSTLRGSDNTSSIEVETVDARDLVNSYQWFGWKLPSGGWGISGNTANFDDQSVYGIRKNVLYLSYVGTDSQAQHVVSMILLHKTNMLHKKVTLKVPMMYHALELGDCVEIDHVPTSTHVTGIVTAMVRQMTGKEFGSILLTVEGE